MAIKAEQVQGERWVIYIGEKFDFSLVTDFRQAYSELPASIKHIEVDLSNTQYMDSSALGMLLNMQKLLADKNLTYSITHCRAAVARILEISRFNKKFTIS